MERWYASQQTLLKSTDQARSHEQALGPTHRSISVPRIKLGPTDQALGLETHIKHDTSELSSPNIFSLIYVCVAISPSSSL